MIDPREQIFGQWIPAWENGDWQEVGSYMIRIEMLRYADPPKSGTFGWADYRVVIRRATGLETGEVREFKVDDLELGEEPEAAAEDCYAAALDTLIAIRELG